LKQQLLSEIADKVQLSNRELLDVWRISPVKNPRKRSESYQQKSDNRFADKGYSQKIRQGSGVARATSSTRQPASRADHAARILLDNMAILESLTNEDHALLCALGAPQGPLFSWMEAQYHEHGVQPWVALRAGLQGHESEVYATRIMTGHELVSADDPGEALGELRHLLNRMLVEQLKTDETQAIAAAKTDPTALQRYRELQARRLMLEATTKT